MILKRTYECSKLLPQTFKKKFTNKFSHGIFLVHGFKISFWQQCYVYLKISDLFCLMLCSDFEFSSSPHPRLKILIVTLLVIFHPFSHFNKLYRHIFIQVPPHIEIKQTKATPHDKLIRWQHLWVYYLLAPNTCEENLTGMLSLLR